MPWHLLLSLDGSDRAGGGGGSDGEVGDGAATDGGADSGGGGGGAVNEGWEPGTVEGGLIAALGHDRATSWLAELLRDAIDGGAEAGEEDEEEAGGGADGGGGDAAAGGGRRTAAWYAARLCDPLYPGAPVSLLQHISMLLRWRDEFDLREEYLNQTCRYMAEHLLPPGNIMPPSLHLLSKVRG